MTAFFVPGLDIGASEEDIYAGFRRTAQARTGHEPLEGRIFRLSCRRGGLDCVAEVGKPDPICGQTVLAILDLGRTRPYVINCGSPGRPVTQVLVEKPVYGVTEFTSPTAA
jgi:hypothetical protein